MTEPVEGNNFSLAELTSDLEEHGRDERDSAIDRSAAKHIPSRENGVSHVSEGSYRDD